MKKIGLTGSLGTGKSVIARILEELGAKVISADEISHAIYEPGFTVYDELVATFGRSILWEDGTINRRKLATLAFAESETIAKLNAITQPKIIDIIKQRLVEFEGEGAKVTVLEAAILIEAGWKYLVDEVWIAIAPRETVIEREVSLGLGEADIEARLSSQLSNEERIRHADVVIDTYCTLDELKAKVNWLWQNLLSNG